MYPISSKNIGDMEGSPGKITYANSSSDAFHSRAAFNKWGRHKQQERYQQQGPQQQQRLISKKYSSGR
jgi:hypothetical protein